MQKRKYGANALLYHSPPRVKPHFFMISYQKQKGWGGGGYEIAIAPGIQVALKTWWRTSVRKSNPSLGSSSSNNNSLVHDPSKGHLTPKEILGQILERRSDKYPLNRTTSKKTCHKRKATQTIKFFYQHKLVACAVRFTSDMLEDDIVQHTLVNNFQLLDHQFSSQSFLF